MDPRMDYFMAVVMVLTTIAFIFSLVGIWKVVERFKRIYWRYKIGNLLYEAWEDSYDFGYSGVIHTGIVMQIIQRGFDEGREDRRVGRMPKAFCYAQFEEKEPAAWQEIEKLVKEKLDEIVNEEQYHNVNKAFFQATERKVDAVLVRVPNTMRLERQVRVLKWVSGLSILSILGLSSVVMRQN